MGKDGVGPQYGKMARGMDKDNIFFYKAHFVMENAAELGLSNEQIEKIKTLKYGIEKNSIKKDADIMILALDIKEALGKDETDINAVNALIDQKYALKAQKAKEEMDACVSLKKILTPEQLKKMKEMHRKGPKGWGKGPDAAKVPMAEMEERGE